MSRVCTSPPGINNLDILPPAGKHYGMARNSTLRTFGSFAGFVKAAVDVLRGPGLLATLAATDPAFREKILLTVTAVNNCYS